MTFTVYLEAIQAGLQKPLPGWTAQKLMAPEVNQDIDRNSLIQPGHREGAVLILLYPNKDNKTNIVFIRRPEYNGVHSGQISLPGGTREPGEHLQTTALREANEEVGIMPHEVTLLGTLSPTYIPPSNFMVYPHVGYQDTQPRFRADEQEVAEIIEAPVSLFLKSETRRTKMWNTSQLGTIEIPFYDIRNHHIWGATAIMLSEFIEIMKVNLP